MAALLDIIGAMIIGGVLMLVTNRGIEYSLREFINHNIDAIVQTDLSTMTQILQGDLRKMGYGIPESNQASIIQTAVSDHLVFLTKSDPNVTAPDTIEYTTTDRDTVWIVGSRVILYHLNRTVRCQGHEPQTTIIGNVTNPVIFRYLDQAGRSTEDKRATRMVEVTLFTMNPHVYLDDDVIQAVTLEDQVIALKKLWRESFWRQTRVVSRNLRR